MSDFEYKVVILDPNRASSGVADPVRRCELTTLESVSFGYKREGGCADFALRIICDLEDLPDVSVDDWVEIYLRDPGATNTPLDDPENLWYAGVVQVLHRAFTDPTGIEVSGQGFFHQLDSCKIWGLRYGNLPDEEDQTPIDTVIERILDHFVLPAGMSDIASRSVAELPFNVGDFHPQRISSASAIRDLLEQVDVTESGFENGTVFTVGADRVARVSVVPPAASGQLYIDFPHPNVEGLELDDDAIDLANVLWLEGGSPIAFNMLPNPDFSELTLAQDAGAASWLYGIGWGHRLGGQEDWVDTLSVATPFLMSDNRALKFVHLSATTIRTENVMALTSAGADRSVTLGAIVRCTQAGGAVRFKVVYYVDSENWDWADDWDFTITAADMNLWAEHTFVLPSNAISVLLYLEGHTAQEAGDIYFDGLVLVNQNVTGLNHYLGNQYLNVFDGQDAGELRRVKMERNPLIRTDTDFDRYKQWWKSRNDLTLLRGQLTLKNYMQLITPEAGWIVLRNLPAGDGTRITRYYLPAEIRYSIESDQLTTSIALGEVHPSTVSAILAEGRQRARIEGLLREVMEGPVIW